MPKSITDQFERRDCTLAFVVNRSQWDRFLTLKKKDEKQSDLLRSILFDWMDRREAELKKEKDYYIT